MVATVHCASRASKSWKMCARISMPTSWSSRPATPRRASSQSPRTTDADIDAWITYAPWAGNRGRAARDRRRRSAPRQHRRPDRALAPRDRGPPGPGRGVDRVLRRRKSRGHASERSPGTPWTDIGGEETWGVVRPAHAEPLTSGTGLLVLGAAVASFVATPEIDADAVSRIDWETNDAFPGWFQKSRTGGARRRVHTGPRSFGNVAAAPPHRVRPRRDHRGGRRSPASRPPPPTSETTRPCSTLRPWRPPTSCSRRSRAGVMQPDSRTT